MKITKSQIKQIIQEELDNVKYHNLMSIITERKDPFDDPFFNDDDDKFGSFDDDDKFAQMDDEFENSQKALENGRKTGKIVDGDKSGKVFIQFLTDVGWRKHVLTLLATGKDPVAAHHIVMNAMPYAKYHLKGKQLKQLIMQVKKAKATYAKLKKQKRK